MIGANAQNISLCNSDLFAGMSEAYGERPVFVTEDGQAFGVGEIDLFPDSAILNRRLVLCMCENDPGGVLGYLALMRAGAVPLMVSAGLPEAALRRLIEHYRPAMAWVPDNRAAGMPETRSVWTCYSYSVLTLGSGEDVALHPNLALLLGTSGSTGSPRFVRLSHSNIASNAASIRSYLNIASDDVPITTLPPTYSYGLSVLHSHILAGSTIALTARTLFDRAFWNFMQLARATSFAGVPYHYEMLKKLRFAAMDLPELRIMTQAGGRMDTALATEFAALCQERHIRFFRMYGQTEATARMAYLPPEKSLAKAGSIGKAIPGGNFWLEDEQGQRLEGPDVTGQLVYSGANVAMGYAQGWQDLAEGDIWKGVLHTGDLAHRDSDGDYSIAGRLKRFLKLFGNRINLQDIEDQLQAAGHQAVCGGEDDRLDVYLVGSDQATARQVKARLVSDLKITPKAIVMLAIAHIPRNEAGKLQYALLDTLERMVLA